MMAASAQAWLPEMALFDGAIAGMATVQAEAWQRRWMGVLAKAPVARTLAVPDGSGTDGYRWETVCGGMRMSMSEGQTLRLAAAALKFRGPPNKLSSADAAVLRKVGDACVRDLLTALLSGFSLSVALREKPSDDLFSSGPAPAVRLMLSVPGVPVNLEVRLSQDMAVNARKGLLPPGRPPPPLGALKSATEGQQVSVGVCIGWARASLNDIRTLETNDVLILDEAMGECLALHIDGRRADIPSIELVQTGSMLALKERNTGARA